VAINTFDLKKSIGIIETAYHGILSQGAVPLTMGGDHTLTWPILRAIARKHGPVALVHVDAHADINDTMFGEKVAHGCPFRRAWEEGLPAERQGVPDRIARHWLWPRRFRLGSRQGLDRGAGRELLAQRSRKASWLLYRGLVR
jgi:arginase family enzyme